ncbi:hypothetical protein [Schumannella luteola]|jgi:hypothetical protein
MVLEWWNDIVQWFASTQGRAITTSVILPFVAILAAGLFAGLITRGALKRFVAHQDREAKASAVAALIASGRKAAVWNSLSAQEKSHIEHQTSEAEVRIRLLPVSGSTLAADWAAHHIASMKRNSVAYSFQAEQSLAEMQDGLVEWQFKPSRAKKLFSQDLAAWKYETAKPEDELIDKQNAWAAQQETAVFETSKV